MLFLWESHLVLILAVLYVCFLLGEPGRLRKQRQMLHRTRATLASWCATWTKLDPAALTAHSDGGDGGSPEVRPATRAGFQLLVSAWALILAFSMFSFASEGNVYISVNLTYVIAGFGAMIFTNQPNALMVYYARMNVFQNAVLLWYFESETRPTIMRRSVVLRTIATLIFFESLEESLVHLMLMAIVLDTKFRTSALEEERMLGLLPLKLFFVGVLPLRVLGVTEWLSNIRDQEFSLQLVAGFIKSIGLLSCMIPIYVMFGTFVAVSLHESFLALGVTYLALGAALTWSGVQVAKLVSPNVLALEGGGSGLVTESLSGGAGDGGGDGDDGGGGRHEDSGDAWCTRSRRATPVAFSSSSSPRALLSAVGFVSSASGMIWKLCFACALAAWLVNWPVLAVVLTTLGKIKLVRRNMLYGEMQANIFFSSGVLLLVTYHDLWFSSMITFLSLTSSFWCFGLTCAKEVIFAHIAKENNTEAFLSHAIKQKFASVGAALEHVVVNTASGGKDTRRSLLQTAMLECRMGHARCHASTLFRKLNQGEVRDPKKRTFANLVDQIEQTTMSDMLIDGKTQMHVEPAGCCAETDWEILHLVLADLARKRHRIVRVWCQNRDDDGGGCAEVLVQFDRTLVVNRSDAILVRLVEEVRGQLVQDLLVVKMRLRPPTTPGGGGGGGLSSTAAAYSPRRTIGVGLGVGGGRGPAPPPSAQDSPLSVLRIALVDDNVLIRKNFARLLQYNLGLPPTSIYTSGETQQACHDFVKLICDNQVDVALFDQNLDYEDGMIKGAELALEARTRGFRGCLILHSSDTNLGAIVNGSRGLFHGAIEKSANANAFVDGLAQAWDAFQDGRVVT